MKTGTKVKIIDFTDLPDNVVEILNLKKYHKISWTDGRYAKLEEYPNCELRIDRFEIIDKEQIKKEIKRLEKLLSELED